MIYQNVESEQSIVGVFLGGKTLMAGKIKDGKVIQKSVRTINNLAAEEDILMEVIGIINEVIDDEVVGIGVGVPSLVDVNKGVVYHPINIPSWREVYLQQILEERFNRKVYLNNDANCFAVGQKYFGKAKKYANVVGLTAGIGFGCGIITNNQLYSGQNCGAGEFGSIPYREHDYEYYCSEKYFEVKYGEKYTDFLERAINNDKIALALFEHYGTDLGNALITILYAIDPEIIVIGGTMAKAYPFFKKTMLEQVKRFPYKNTIQKLKIEVSEEPDIAILGAAALYFDSQQR